ncbi:unnamed protein product [Owenia fusiformis]|uniref:receptor protein-tyrosine kinase n=1 Tax=Owenia fusiformis TaxID=6347 RepID=A0A8S4NN49_OWEFU|nr:unnamed protein product [Owenia fusiformis]
MVRKSTKMLWIFTSMSIIAIISGTDLVQPQIAVHPTNTSSRVGGRAMFICNATGVPAPTIEWQHNGVKIPNIAGNNIHFHKNMLIISYVKADHVGSYRCKARSFIGLDWSDSAYLLISRMAAPPGKYCSPYRGTICSKHLGESLIYYNHTGSTDLNNEQIVKNLWPELIKSLDSTCSVHAEKLLCHYAFPDCMQTSKGSVALPLCREDCEATQQLFCMSEWITIQNNKQQGIVFRHRGHFRLPVCSELPSRLKSPCSDAFLYEHKPHLVSSHCYHGNGQYYNGTVNTTRSGYQCQDWLSQHPHRHMRHPHIFPEVRDASNYCRNPGGEENSPWCYTINQTKRWEKCDIPQCPPLVSSHPPMVAASSIFESYSIEFWLLMATTVLFAAILIGVIWILVRVFIHPLCKNAPTSGELSLDLDDLSLNAAYYSFNPSYYNIANHTFNELEYPRNKLLYIKDIGKGAFGRVFQARAPGLETKDSCSMVAVKMLKDGATYEMQLDFEREAMLLLEFNHPNIISLLGMCTNDTPMCLLFEYMPHGDLNSYLRKRGPGYIHGRRHGDNIVNDQAKLSNQQQVAIAQQICAGMVYLSHEGFVHRDLATRNCLVGHKMKVKISDFGLAQPLTEKGQFIGNESDPVPIRWMAPEAIIHNVFSIQSDIWSFGIALWEIFSFALQPYFGMTHEEVIKSIQHGGNMSRPDNCPYSVYEIMQSCWQLDPAQRPMFTFIKYSLDVVQNKITQNGMVQSKTI